MQYKSLSKKEEDIAKIVVDSAYKVHSALGPGLLENIYEICFCYELENRGLKYKRQVSVPIIYEEMKLEDTFRIDVLIEKLVICELKAVEAMKPVFEAQLLTYLKLTNKRLGFLINFNVHLIKDGIKRMIL